MAALTWTASVVADLRRRAHHRRGRWRRIAAALVSSRHRGAKELGCKSFH
jgi:hypothetical protein